VRGGGDLLGRLGGGRRRRGAAGASSRDGSKGGVVKWQRRQVWRCGGGRGSGVGGGVCSLEVEAALSLSIP
jgi:hypothetical protein